MSDENELMHIGVLRKSGRYPWGSGKNPHQRNKMFLDYVDDLKSKGLTETEIVKLLQLDSTTQLRAVKSIAKNELRKAEASQAQRLKEKGYSNTAIGKKMGKNESSIRALLEPSAMEKRSILETTANMLKDNLKDGYLDIGEGAHQFVGVSKQQLNNAVAILKEEGYQIHYMKVPQLGTTNFTSVKVLVPPGVPYSVSVNNKDKIKVINQRTDDRGRSFYGLRPPTNVDSKRISVNYEEDGGAQKDGIIELRPGVKDLDLGASKYAQVRIAVDGTHYLKGMAIYADDLPKGIDIRFNTNKSKSTPKMDTMKKLKDDIDNPFGAVIKPGGQRGALNIINEEGDWYNWSKNFSSQMLSKQSPALIKQQLNLTYDIKKTEFDEIMKLTNPVVRQKLLLSFADDMDSSAVSLKAMGLPRTRSHVILPVPSMKETEIYAPQYINGEKVVLIRHPHGGIFEIPELTVNNRQPIAKAMLKQAKDAVGIHPKVAAQLSGADFDGDTVLVIPNKGKAVKTMAALAALKEFDPVTAYPAYPGMKTMKAKQTEMGIVSNLITDMSIKGASIPEIVRAVRHSMVVIDAEKKNLNFRQSYADHGIAELKMKYQGKLGGGSNTLISRASSDLRVPERKPRPASEGGPIDKQTGEKRFVNTGNMYPERKPRPASMGGPIDKATGKKVFIETGKMLPKTTLTTNMLEAKDAFELSSGTQREALYADYANKLKVLANTSRKEAVNSKVIPYSPTARITYAKEVSSLSSKLNTAIKNKPLERQAQILAGVIVAAKKQANPNMDAETLKKISGQALVEARIRSGAKKQRISITNTEWEAIQAGAISTKRLSDILDNTDLDLIKQYATPRSSTVMSPAKLSKAQSLLDNGYTQSEIAESLGVSISTVNESLNK